MLLYVAAILATRLDGANQTLVELMIQVDYPRKMIERTIEKMKGLLGERWSHFLTQAAKVDSPMQRMIPHEDAETVFG